MLQDRRYPKEKTHTGTEKMMICTNCSNVGLGTVDKKQNNQRIDMDVCFSEYFKIRIRIST